MLWQLVGDRRLEGKLKAPLLDTATTVVVSDVSLWEVAIKVQCGKLRMSVMAFDAHISALGYERLAIARAHVIGVAALPRPHGDPFDHLLISQGIIEKIPILTGDGQFSAYPVQLAIT